MRSKVTGATVVVIYIIFLLICAETSLRLGGGIIRFAKHEPDNPGKVILSIGESTTFGLGVRKNESFTSILDNKLNKKGNYSVINLGVPAIVSANIYRNFEKQLLDYNPDTVIVLMGINDFNSELNGHRSSGFISEFFSDLRIYKLYKVTIDYLNSRTSIRNGTLKFYQPGGGYRFSEKQANELRYNMRKITSLADKYKVRVIFMTYISCGTQKVDSIIVQEALEDGAEIVINDIKCENSEYFTKDNWHPSYIGHSYMADNLYKHFI